MNQSKIFMGVRSLQSNWNLGVAIFFGVSLSLVHVLPEAWGRNEGPLAVFVEFMMDVIPSIAKNARTSRFPGVLETYLSIVWSAILGTIVVCVRKKYALDRVARIPEKGRWLVFFSYVAILIVIFFAFYVGDVNRENSCYWRDIYCAIFKRINDSRLWLSIYGTFMYVVCSSFIVGGIVGARNYCRLWLSK